MRIVQGTWRRALGRWGMVAGCGWLALTACGEPKKRPPVLGATDSDSGDEGDAGGAGGADGDTPPLSETSGYPELLFFDPLRAVVCDPKTGKVFDGQILALQKFLLDPKNGDTNYLNDGRVYVHGNDGARSDAACDTVVDFTFSDSGVLYTQCTVGGPWFDPSGKSLDYPDVPHLADGHVIGAGLDGYLVDFETDEPVLFTNDTTVEQVVNATLGKGYFILGTASNNDVEIWRTQDELVGELDWSDSLPSGAEARLVLGSGALLYTLDDDLWRLTGTSAAARVEHADCPYTATTGLIVAP